MNDVPVISGFMMVSECVLLASEDVLMVSEDILTVSEGMLGVSEGVLVILMVSEDLDGLGRYSDGVSMVSKGPLIGSECVLMASDITQIMMEIFL